VTRHIAIVGASLAGLRAAEAARRLGFDGRLTLIGAEAHLPYTRPPLTKEFLTGGSVESLALTSSEQLHDLGVDLLPATSATGIDLGARTLELGTRRLRYDGLVIATGATPRRLSSTADPGLKGCHVVRTMDDALELRSEIRPGTRLVVIGAGFIGAETSSSARKLGAEVCVVEALSSPLSRALGELVGSVCGRLHHRNGVELRCGVAVEAVSGRGRVEKVRLSDGDELPADVVVVGAGVVPATRWLEGSGLTLRDGLVCDANLCAGPPGVYAAGDVVRWPHPQFGELRLESWTGAAEQAATAMRNLLDPANAVPHEGVPYFWSDQYGVRIQCLGVATGDVRVVAGSIEELRFIALHCQGDRLIGVSAIGCPHLIMKLRPLVRRGAGSSEAEALCRDWDPALAADAV
jgi:NADPH-dependent 2,4-dienoyl-CoA reductase/sulfur reductase-like enzyme